MKSRVKERVNWTIDFEAMNLLRSAQKLSGRTVSQLVSAAIKKAFRDPIEWRRKRMKELFAEGYKLKKELEELEEMKEK